MGLRSGGTLGPGVGERRKGVREVRRAGVGGVRKRVVGDDESSFLGVDGPAVGMGLAEVEG